MSVKKIFAALCLFVYVFASLKAEECETRDGNDVCIPKCTYGRILYTPGCEERAMSRRSCRRPVARFIGFRCDYHRCDCEQPYVWDEAAKKCVPINECSNQSQLFDKTVACTN